MEKRGWSAHDSPRVEPGDAMNATNSARNKIAVTVMALVLGMASQLAGAQTFKHVPVQKNVKIAQIASGGMSAWALATNGHPYIYKSGKFALANPISLTQIAVGGGNLRQADAVWGLDSSGFVYKASKSGTSWVFSQIPGVLSSIAVGIGYQDSCHPYEVWGVSPISEIFRYDFCLQGFVQAPGALLSVSVGGGNVWGYSGVAQLFRFDFSQQSFQQIGQFGEIEQLTVGPSEVFASVNGGYLYGIISYQGVHGLQYFSGYIWGGLKELKAGGDGVWGIDSGHLVGRLDPGLAQLVVVQGAQLASISVGSGAGVWGIDSNGQVFAFSTP